MKKGYFSISLLKFHQSLVDFTMHTFYFIDYIITKYLLLLDAITNGVDLLILFSDI
jgi:hypothetical protein